MNSLRDSNLHRDVAVTILMWLAIIPFAVVARLANTQCVEQGGALFLGSVGKTATAQTAIKQSGENTTDTDTTLPKSTTQASTTMEPETTPTTVQNSDSKREPPPVDQEPIPKDQELSSTEEQPLDQTETSPADTADGNTLEADPTKPVTEMAEQEIKQAIKEYRGWVHAGRIQVELDFSQITANQLGQIAECYVLTTPLGSVLVHAHGDIDRHSSLPPGKLLGDVPRNKWPMPLRQAAESDLWQGRNSQAILALTDVCELKIYRKLAAAVGGTPPSGSRFILRFDPSSGGELDLQLVNSSFAEPRTF